MKHVQPAIVACFVCLISFESLADEALVNEFRDRAPTGWVNAFPKHNEFELKYSYKKISGNTPSPPTDVTIACDHGDVVEVESRADNVASIYGFNSQYEFEAKRKADGTHLLVSAHVFRPNPAVPSRRLAVGEYYSSRGCINIPYLIPIHLLLSPESDEIEIQDAIHETVSGKQLVRVDFNFSIDDWYRAPGVDDTRFGEGFQRGAHFLMQHFTSASIWFDKDKNWLPVSAIIQENSGNSWDIEWQYKNQGERIIPKQIVQRYSDGSVLEYFDFAYSFDQLPSSRFRLVHYGLPEPPGTGRNNFLWLAFFVVGLAFIVGALVFKSRKRK